MEKENPSVQTLDSVISDVKLFAEKVLEIYPKAEVWLYGSYAKKCARPASDIDVGVIVPDGSFASEDYFWLGLQVFTLGSDINSSMEPFLIEENHDLFNFIDREIRGHGIRIA